MNCFCSHSWRGAMIEADQTTEPQPSAVEKEAVAPVPANPAPPEGQYCALVFYFPGLLQIW